MKTKIQTLIKSSALILGAAFFGSIAQAAQGPQPSICARACWGARNGTCTSIMGVLSRAIIHHTAGSGDYSTVQDPQKIRNIQNYHMDSNGWCDIGYHWL